MNVSISLKTKTKETNVTSRLKVEKKEVTATAGNKFISELKSGLPKKETMKAGKDRAQLIIKVDGKTTLNQKFAKIDAASLENVRIQMATK